MPLEQQELEQIKAGNLDPLKEITSLGIVVRTKAQEEVFQNNLRTQVREEVISSEELPAYKNIETALEKLTGAKKNDGEKATEFLTRVVSPLQKTVKEQEDKLNALKEKGVDKNDPVVLALQKERDDAIQAKEQATKEWQEKFNGHLVKGEVARMRAAAEALPMNVPDEIKPDIIDSRINKWLAENEIRVNEKGETEIFNKTNNRVEVNTADLSRKSGVDFVSAIFENVKAKEGAAGGTGQNGSGKQDNGQGANGYAGAKSQNELHEQLQKQGLSPSSKEFDEAYSAQQKAYEQQHGQPMPLIVR